MNTLHVLAKTILALCCINLKEGDMKMTTSYRPVTQSQPEIPSCLLPGSLRFHYLSKYRNIKRSETERLSTLK